MNAWHFTHRVRQVLAIAREVVVGLDHEYVGTEHILLALLATRDSLGCVVLTQLGADPDAVRAAVLRTVQRGGRPTDSSMLPYTDEAKEALKLSMAAAVELGQPYVGTEHLLLGLIRARTGVVRKRKGIAAQVLADAGVTDDGAREEVRRLAGAGRRDPDVAAAWPPADRPPPAA